MRKNLYPVGVEVFAQDLQRAENQREEEVLRRWTDLVESPGVIAKRLDDDVLFPTTGASAGYIVVSAGEAYTPNGEYIYITGGTLSGLTDADMFATGNTYVAAHYAAVTGDTRADVVTGVQKPTFEWNASGGTTGYTTISLVNARTGSTYVVLAQVTSISATGDIVLNTTVRDLFRLSSSALPTDPASVSVNTGHVETDFAGAGTGITRVSGRESPAYVTLSFPSGSHNDGLLGYLATLTLYDQTDTEVTGSTQQQMLYVSGDGPAYTGTTFYGLTTGMRAKAKVQAVSNGAIPVLGSGTTSEFFIVGSGSTLVMPTVGVTQRSTGLELDWALTGASSGISRFEVFASTGSTVTGSTVDYRDLAWSGYAGKALIPADKNSTVYWKVRGVDPGGRVTSDYVTGASTFTGLAQLPTPKNPHIEEIRPLRMTTTEVTQSYQDSKYSMALRGGMVNDHALVRWEWNWDDIEGTGGTGKMQASNLTGMTSNYLVGMRLYVPQTGLNYYIYANEASTGGSCVLYVRNMDGSSVDLSGYDPTAGNPAAIHCGGDSYHLVLKRYEDNAGSPGSERTYQRIRVTHRYSTPGTDKQAYEVALPLGAFQNLDVWAVEEDDPAIPPSETTSSTTSRIEFDDIAAWNSSASITAVATDYGFEIRITATAGVLDDVSGFVYGYTNASTGVTFTDPQHHIQVTAGPITRIPIAVEQADTYYIAVKPVKGGQYVGNAKTASVTSGGGGRPPDVKELPAIVVDLRPNGQEVEYDATTDLVKITGESTGYTGTTGVVALSDLNPVRDVRGKRLIVTATGTTYVYAVRDQRGTTGGTQYLRLELITGGAASIPEVFVGGTTVAYDGSSGTTSAIKAARQITAWALANEIRIVGLSFNCWYTDGTQADPAIIRVYQQSAESYATSIEVNSYGGDPLYNAATLEITRARGDLILVVDAYSSATASANEKEIRGELTILYRDIETGVSVS